MSLILAFLAAAATQDPPDIPKEVRRILQEYFGRLADPERVEACATAVSSTIAGARPPEWSRRILAELSKPADFAVSSARHRFGVFEPSKVPPALQKEGFHLQLDYLALQVDRVARKPWTDERRRQALEQIDQVTHAIEAVLKEKLPGDAGAARAIRTADELRSAWKGSLDLPYNRIVDGPVTAAELSRVVDGIRAAAKAYPTVTLTAEEAGRRERLAELKVLHLENDVREAAYKFCAACFAEYSPMAEKVNQWEQRVKKARAEK